MTRTIVLEGSIPSKKNNYKVAKRGKGKKGLFIPDSVLSQIHPLQIQLQSKWHRAPPLRHPQVSLCFHVSTDEIDRDGMTVTLLDIMQAAGVLLNDNVREFNGLLRIEPAVLVLAGKEKIVIEIEESSR